MFVKVILLEPIRGLGILGDIVRVKAGYVRNYLIPQGKVIKATRENIDVFESRRAELEQKAAEVLAVAQKRAEPLTDFTLTIIRKALDEGKLFGSVNVRDIVEALNAKGIVVENREVYIPQGAIRAIGEYEVQLLFHNEVSVMIKLIVEPER